MKKLHIQSLMFKLLQSKFVNYFVLFFILISILAVMASTFEEMAPYQISLFSITYISSFVFLLEFVARIITAPLLYPHIKAIRARIKYVTSFYGFVDFVAIVPFLLTYLFWDSDVVHIIVLPYIFIIFKLIRHSPSFQLIGQVLVSVRDELITAYTACMIMVSFSAILMYYIEREAQPEVFANVGDSIWWAVVTFTTTGYGDIYPITPLGKFFGIIISMLGIAMIAIPTGIVSSAFINIIQERTRKATEERLARLKKKEEASQENASSRNKRSSLLKKF